MASCGVQLFDEKKEVDVKEEHSLNNIVAFSSKRRQMSAPSKEGLIISDKDDKEVDRRTKIVYKDSNFNFDSYYNLSQITGKLLKGEKGVGSCTNVRVGKDQYWLTCAHNLAEYGVRAKRVVHYTDFHIYKARQGEGLKTSLEVYLGDDKNVIVHPKYNGEPDCGFDIGLIPTAKTISTTDCYDLLWTTGNDSSKDAVWASYGVKPKHIKKGMGIELAGFPGEKGGWPYTHRGKIVEVTKTKLGGHLLLYDVDATPGNSGSCLSITDKDFLSNYRRKYNLNDKIKKVTVGVHTGHCAVDNLNYGTLITPSMGKWIRKVKKNARQALN